MQPLPPHINRLNILLIVAVLVSIAGGFKAGQYNGRLQNPVAHRKILSLELAWTNHRADAVKKSWEYYEVRRKNDREPRIKQIVNVKPHIKWDFLFIVTYGFLLIIIAKRTAAHVEAHPEYPVPKGYTKAAQILPWVAMGGDAIENFFMLEYLDNTATHAILFSLPAFIKFLAVGYVIGYGLYASRLFQNILRAARLFAPGLVIVIISYFVFTGLPQGHDVIIQVAEYPWSKWLTILTLFFWMWFTWYSSRLVSYTRMQEFGNSLPRFFHMHPPRLLAFNALVSIQSAIITLPSLKVPGANAVIAFILLQNIVYFALAHYLRPTWTLGWKRFALFVVVVVSGGYMYMLGAAMSGISPAAAEHVYLLYFSGSLYVMELFMVWFWLYRSRHFSKKEWLEETDCRDERPFLYLSILKWRILKVLVDRKKEEQTWFDIFNALAIMAMILYVLNFCITSVADNFGPLAFALLAFAVIVGVTNIISVLSINYKSNYFVVLLVWAIILGSFYDPYPVRVINGKQTGTRPTISEYFDKWIMQHEGKIRQELDRHANDSTYRYPVYIVMSNGGASRSGYWAASVLGYMQDQSIRLHRDKPNEHGTIFSDHLFCLAGASGGSVGNATFYALLKKNLIEQPSGTDNYQEQSQAFLKNDFLTPVLTRWLGSDIVQHVIPLPTIGDRGAALEKSMERHEMETIGSNFERPFTEVIDKTGVLPILYINATSVQKGIPAVVSSVKIENSISARIDVVGTQANSAPIRYSTAYVLGARFPYVSPAGKLVEDYYVDGGYFDNTGAGIVQETLTHVLSIMKQRKDEKQEIAKIYDKLEFKVLYLNNSSLVTSDPSEINPVLNDAASPILTVLGTYESQTNVNNRRLENFLKNCEQCGQMRIVKLYTSKDEEEYPMNWVISDYNLTRMNERLESAKVEIDRLLEH